MFYRTLEPLNWEKRTGLLIKFIKHFATPEKYLKLKK